jgi:hypothetical protein
LLFFWEQTPTQNSVLLGLGLGLCLLFTLLRKLELLKLGIASSFFFLLFPSTLGLLSWLFYLMLGALRLLQHEGDPLQERSALKHVLGLKPSKAATIAATSGFGQFLNPPQQWALQLWLWASFGLFSIGPWIGFGLEKFAHVLGTFVLCLGTWHLVFQLDSLEKRKQT